MQGVLNSITGKKLLAVPRQLLRPVIRGWTEETAVMQGCRSYATATATATATQTTTTSSTSIGSTPSTQNGVQNASGPVIDLKPLANVAAKEKDVIVRLMMQCGSHREVRQYLKHFSSRNSIQLAVIKIGGGVLEEGVSLNRLVESLAFLQRVGLFPIVVHGGGPQLNAELDAAGLPAEYIGGLRVTSPEILSIAKRVFARENLKLVDALEQNGTRARPVTQVFEAEPLDTKTYGLVGQVTKINVDALASSILSGCVPVISSLGMTAQGQILNINADVAALELARELRPLKIIFLNTTAGLKDDKGQVIRQISLSEEFDWYMSQAWVKHGMRLKIKEIKTCLDALPSTSSVSITSPEHLQEELFGNRAGTHIVQGEKIKVHTSLTTLDLEKIRNLIYSSFGRKLVADYFGRIENKVHKIYVTDSYKALAILVKDTVTGIPYLDKFAVAGNAQGEGLADMIWGRIVADNAQMFWRSRLNNHVNPWYFNRATGHLRTKEWNVFWYGLDDINIIQRCVTQALSLPPSLETAKAAGASTAQQQQQAAANVVPASRYRVGLLGARGYVGGHVLRLVTQHQNVELACAASSTQAGKPVSDLCSRVDPQMKFEDINPTNVAQYTEKNKIDAWFLALPDQASGPYVEALRNGMHSPILIDLSSDHRFDNQWVYGNPETNRRRLRGARRIANPGCYATGALLSLAPLVNPAAESLGATAGSLLDGQPSVFGVSGYSGAGSKPSEKNDPKRLADNLLPYKLVQHTHEREVSHQLGQPIYFVPHVAPFFQGITLTISAKLKVPVSTEELYERYRSFYEKEALVKVIKEIPEVKANMNKHTVSIGGFGVDHNSRHVVLVATLDNLLKGAATQAIQNLNLSLGLNELEGIDL